LPPFSKLVFFAQQAWASHSEIHSYTQSWSTTLPESSFSCLSVSWKIIFDKKKIKKNKAKICAHPFNTRRITPNYHSILT
jgi:hypothetical protein